MKYPHHLFYLGLFVLLFPGSAYSQIVPDSTVGTSLTPNALVNGDRIDGGTIRNINLFHSFQEFNINAGRSVYFTNPAEVTSIFTRVTGANPSNINGTLGVLGNANLFFMNPNGVIFANSARLDIKGSFLGTTANTINFADGSTFSTTPNTSTSNPLLSVSVPVGLGFGSNPGAIVVRGEGHSGTNRSNYFIPRYPNVTNPQLQLQPGKTLGLIGGEIVLDGAKLSIPDGRIEIGSVAGNQTLPLRLNQVGFNLDYSGIKGFQDIRLTSSAADVSGRNGGSLQFTGRRVSLTQGTELLAHTLGTNGVGKGIVIRADESLELLASKGNGSTSSIMASVQPGASGKGGNITIETPDFRMAYGAWLRAELYGNGQSGDVTFKTKNFEMVGSDVSGESEDVLTDMSLGLAGSNVVSGRSGTLTINTENFRLANGARIRSDIASRASGQLGNINIKATDVEVSGVVNEGNARAYRNSWISSTPEAGSFGQAGKINIEAQRIRLLDSGSIRADILGTGTGGTVKLQAPDIEIAGFNQLIGRGSRISAEVRDVSAQGKAGNVFVETQRLRVADGGRIIVGTIGRGNAGNLVVNASESVEIVGAYLFPDNRVTTSGFQATVYQGATGQGGNISISTPILHVTGGGEIAAAVLGNGSAGNIEIQAGEVSVSGKTANGLQSSQITAASSSNTANERGSAGFINIHANQLNVTDGAEISVRGQQQGKAGNLNITADTLRLDNAGKLRADVKTGIEGNITINADTLFMSRGSEITTTADTNANGGNITLDIEAIVQLFDSDITANAVQGKGGNININTQGIFSDTDSDITASSELGINGVVNITTPDIKQENSLQEQPSNFVSTDNIVASSCLTSRNVERGTLVVTGSGRLPENPNDSLGMAYELLQVQAVNTKSATTPQNLTRIPWKIGDPIVEVRGLQVVNGRLLVTAASNGDSISQTSELTCNLHK